MPNVPNVTDFTGQIAQQHDLIGEIRVEIQLVDADEVDKWLLDSLAKQLSACISPNTEMIHIDPVAVKLMLDTKFRKAYVQDVKASIIEQER
ncbi:hypothetical protein N0V91_006756 [Didymella pomorum]|uniref:Uncharacterized protein n=1 Tax=Didymella pomorum TaxID=749634 RepID=A0A9W8ZEN8_9PLEO|nr:hypothetical protein N0V91_006756 [Didymella pomorum]